MPIDPPPQETASNGPENGTISSDGTDVDGVNADNMDTASNVTFDARGQLRGFTVSGKCFFKHNV